MPARIAPLLAALGLLFAAAAAHAQTLPQPYDLSQGDYVFTAWPENSPAGTYPQAMRFHRGPSQDPGLESEPNADYTDAYNLTAGSRINGLGTDGFSFFNTGTAGNLGAAVLALNTAGLQNVQVAWTGGTVAAGGRPYRIRLQYRVGGGPYQDVPGPVEYVAAADGHSETFQSVLPAAANDQPVVYVRWKYYQAGTGSGTRPRLRVDDITVSTSDSPASGTGSAVLEENVLRGGQTHTLEFELFARSDDAGDLLTHVDLTLPESFGTVAAEAVVLTPAGATVTVEGRTVRVAGATISQSAPLRIAVTGVAIPDVSGAFTFGVRTGAGSAQTVALAQQPELRVWSTPEPLSAVKVNNAQGVSTRLGEWVTVRGVVTVSDQFRTGTGVAGPSYFQDETAGMAVFSPSGVSERVLIGDDVILLGRVDQFFGLNQLDDRTTVIETIQRNVPTEPITVTLAQLAQDGQGGVEVWEGRLVRVDGVTVNTPVWNASGSGTNYQLNDGTATLDVRINPNVDFAGQSAPSGPFSIVGVVSQFRPGPPLIGGYQLMPRSGADILTEGNPPAITSRAPFEQAATPTSVTLTWTTSQPAHTEVRYTDVYTGASGTVADETPKTEHTITVPGLSPATIYALELRSATGEDTTRIQNYHVSTTAPVGTTHAIRPYFNRSVDNSLTWVTPAVVRNFREALVERINAATHSVDIALYSLSGTNGSAIANALIAAHNRGVRVRVVMEHDVSTTAPPNALRSAGVPLITDTFGANPGDALHHNKFGVFDVLALAEAPERVWVFNGSWNPTDPGTLTHHQNVVYVQDGALARAYEREFEQMWGSSTATPNAANSRFGARKTAVTPTVFWIGDVYTRLLFSPQGFGPWGSTEAHIIEALETADHAIHLGLNLITRQPLVDAMFDRFQAGVDVRGAVGEITTTGSVFNALAAWADVHEHSQSQFGLLHHKYALVDPGHPYANPITITGSHNWSRAANERNDENTLIIHSADVTNQFMQELALRYAEAGGEGTFPVSVEPVDTTPGTFSLSGNYPNPFRDRTAFSYTLPASSEVTVVVYDVLGREVERLVEAAQPAGTYTVTLDGTRLSSGTYLYRVEARTNAGTFAETGRMVRLR